MKNSGEARSGSGARPSPVPSNAHSPHAGAGINHNTAINAKQQQVTTPPNRARRMPKSSGANNLLMVGVPLIGFMLGALYMVSVLRAIIKNESVLST
jgi:hypothetical protein